MSCIIRKYQYEFEVNVSYDGSEFYSVFVTMKSNGLFEEHRFAQLARLSKQKKDFVLSKIDTIIDEYLENKKKLSEISEGQAMYEGLTNKPLPCGCCDRREEICHFADPEEKK